MRDRDITGRRFGRLTVVCSVGSKPMKWRCLCDCGKYINVRRCNLGRHANSCGCLRQETSAATGRAAATHGSTGSPEYISWSRIMQRCRDINNPAYPRYGGAGVLVCDRWCGKEGFINFLADVGKRPTPKHQMGRKNDSGNYEPGNCWWQTPLEQGENRKDQVWLEFNGERLRVKEWAARLGLHRRSLLTRLENGWSVERALTTKVMAQFRHR